MACQHKKKRKLSSKSDESIEKKPLKKQKKIKDESYIPSSIPKDIKFLVSDSKILKCAQVNNVSWRDTRDASYTPKDNDDEDDLPKSSQKNKLLPKREHQNSLNIDYTQKYWGTSLKNNKHLVNLIANGLNNTLSPNKILEIAIQSNLEDSYTINTSIEEKIKKKSIIPNNNIQKSDIVIHSIELLGIEDISHTYNFNSRLSRSIRNETFKYYSDKTKKIRARFFNESEDQSSTIYTDIEKSLIFKKIKDSHKKQYDAYKSNPGYSASQSSFELKKSIPTLTREYLKLFRFPPQGNERKCKNGENCLFFTFKSFQSNKDQRYIGKEFLLPIELENFRNKKILPEKIGQCIDCTLKEWSSKIYIEVLQFNIIPENPINTFKVKIGEKEYSEHVCLPQTFRDGQPTGICGFVPFYSTHLRDYIHEIKILDEGEKKNIIYLAEINTDFRLTLVR